MMCDIKVAELFFFFFAMQPCRLWQASAAPTACTLRVMKSDVFLIGSALSALIYMCIEAAFPRNAH